MNDSYDCLKHYAAWSTEEKVARVYFASRRNKCLTMTRAMRFLALKIYFTTLRSIKTY